MTVIVYYYDDTLYQRYLPTSVYYSNTPLARGYVSISFYLNSI